MSKMIVGSQSEFEAFTLGVLAVLESKVLRPAEKIRWIESAAKMLDMDRAYREMDEREESAHG